MSFDLALWKRAPSAKTAMLAECYAAILEDGDHPAMARVDLAPLMSDLAAIYGAQQKEFFGQDPDSCPLLFSMGGGTHGNWLQLNLNWSTHRETTNQIVPLALKHGLLVYDPQAKTVWGNRRPPKQPKKKATSGQVG